MANSILEQYRISDFLQWFKEKALAPNPYFQRGAVWVPAARVFFIDTILRRLPIPKIYIRTKIDLNTKKSVREIVDGQQRLRTIIDFSEDKLALTKRAGEFSGLKYSTLSDEQKETFLTYAIGVEQLINQVTQTSWRYFLALIHTTLHLTRRSSDMPNFKVISSGPFIGQPGIGIFFGKNMKSSQLANVFGCSTIRSWLRCLASFWTGLQMVAKLKFISSTSDTMMSFLMRLRQGQESIRYVLLLRKILMTF